MAQVMANVRKPGAGLISGAAGVLVAAAGALSGCAGVPAVGDPGNRLIQAAAGPGEIHWPEAYAPEDAVFFVHNSIETTAPPEAVWAVLIDAGAWPEWYRGAENLSVAGGDDGRLQMAAEISWRTMDLNFVSRITEFEPPYRLSWESRRNDIQGYHAWLIERTPTGSRVVTDESQHGFLAHMQKLFLPNKLRELHDEWLAGLAARAEALETARSGEGS